MRFSELIPVLQMAIGPVILISGVGLLLLSMTNRFGRVIDRARQTAEVLRHAGADRDRCVAQLKMLHRRARLLRRAIILAVASVLMAALLVITVFITAAIRSDMGLPVMVLFLASMSFLIISLLFFIQDLNLSLGALALEIGVESDSTLKAH